MAFCPVDWWVPMCEGASAIGSAHRILFLSSITLQCLWCREPCGSVPVADQRSALHIVVATKKRTPPKHQMPPSPKINSVNPTHTCLGRQSSERITIDASGTAPSSARLPRPVQDYRQVLLPTPMTPCTLSHARRNGFADRRNRLLYRWALRCPRHCLRQLLVPPFWMC